MEAGLLFGDPLGIKNAAKELSRQVRVKGEKDDVLKPAESDDYIILDGCAR